tara:strand:+ start:285 stop:1799 length:1515 start_codon:yes stop_codon:yes gene_type:complete
MTIAVSNNTPRVSYTVSQGATQTSFTVNFEFFAEADLNVYVDDTLKTLTADYTVSGGNGSTGAVAISVTGATGGSTVVITRDIALERTTDFPTQGAFNISSLNTELDKLVAIDADVDDTISRSIRLKDQDASASMELPLLASRKGTVLGFNATTGAAEAGPTIANVNSLSAITANINTVAGISANVTTVAGIQANVSTVAGISSAVSTVAGISSAVSAVNSNATNINAVNSNSSNINTVAGIASDITTVAGIASNVTAVAGDATDIGTVAGSISSVNTVASNLSSINDFAARYRVASSEPSSSLDVGDLLFDTTANQLKVYRSSGWIAASAFGNLSSDTTPELGGNLDVLTHSIVSSSDRNIAITPNGAGVVRLDGNVDISTGAIDLKNSGTQSYIRFYCESSNAHYAQLQAPAHSAFSGNITLTMPATTGTLALTSQIPTVPTSGIANGNVATFTTGVADDDFLRVNGTSIEGRSASELLSDIGATTEATAEANSVALAIALG